MSLEVSGGRPRHGRDRCLAQFPVCRALKRQPLRLRRRLPVAALPDVRRDQDLVVADAIDADIAVATFEGSSILHARKRASSKPRSSLACFKSDDAISSWPDT